MAHELTLRKDGRYEMAFVGETPWHGLGQNVTKGASIGVWAKEAGMEWEALAGTPAINVAPRDEPMQDLIFSDYKGLYRSDTLAPLGIVGARYQPHQPREILEFFREFTEGGGWHIHTAGTLRGGRRLWAMATCEDATQYVKSYKGKASADPVAMNMLLATSLDGSMQTTAALTQVRVVCANTFRQALEGGSQAMVRLSHRSTFDSSYIKRELGVESAQKTFAAFMEKAREMAETPVNLDEARELLNKVLRDPALKPKKAALDLSWLGEDAVTDGEEEPGDSRSVARVLALFQGEGRGSDLPTAKGTRWGLFNALTEHVDHEMGRTPDTRLDSAWFGRGNGFKQEAYKILTEA